MHFSTKKINNYVVKDGKAIGVYQTDNETFMQAGIVKERCPRSVVDVSLSSLYRIENTPYFANSFWCDKKRRTVTADSDAMVADLVTQTAPGTNPWINTTQYSTPVYYADMTTQKVQVYHTGHPGSNFERDMKSVPIHPSWQPAAGSDGHITIVDITNWKPKLWEFWQFKRDAGKCYAGWGGMMPDPQTSTTGVIPPVNGEMRGATATSLPVIGGTMLMDELESGVIPHMLSFATQNPKWAYIAPALRTDGQQNGATGIIPAGQIFQFPEDIVINPVWTPITKMMVAAVRDYGMIQRDRSGCFCFYAEDISWRGLGAEPYKAYYGGKALWDVIKEFPFNQLKAVNL